jgi:hypothetical protein
MNLSIKIKLLVVTLVILFNAYAQDNKSTITIQTNVDSAALFIDNNFVGVANKFQIEEKIGIHSLLLIDNLKRWNAETIEDTIEIKDTKELFLSYNFKSQTLLNTNPQDVRVYENDSLIGFTPILLEAGFKNLSLEKPDYTSLIVTYKEINKGQIPKLQFDGEAPKKKFYGSTLFTVLLGTAIALGAATAYYKLEADDLYEEYKVTGDPGLVDNIDHYDNISAGTFIAMEICVGGLIYFFLTN